MGEWQHPAHYTEQAQAYAKARRGEEIALFVRFALPALCEAARGHGYALALHGSQARDLDLIAIPWTDDAGSADELLRSLAEATKRMTGWGHLENRGARTEKPHGRFATTILASAEVSLDISVMPRNSRPGGHRPTCLEGGVVSTERLTAAVVALSEAGIPPDVQELLLHGDPMRGIPPHALRKALTASGIETRSDETPQEVRPEGQEPGGEAETPNP